MNKGALAFSSLIAMGTFIFFYGVGYIGYLVNVNYIDQLNSAGVPLRLNDTMSLQFSTGGPLALGFCALAAAAMFYITYQSFKQGL